ncbi:hypothetical protein GCM10008111_28060 [Alishewanella tabrizica]|uniref:Uncharacterized protein n=1 Tax=Alishewanella tabrizica TaxID=671278 RepID=A0ABQ2WRR6_9ALTE|nr:hypothetical protein GCM10008111_28060 [Alishewanella tabrizica]
MVLCQSHLSQNSKSVLNMDTIDIFFIIIKALGVGVGYKFAYRLFRNEKYQNENRDAVICGVTAFIVMLVFYKI